MAYAEFTGELDAPEKGFVPFDGELDKEPGGFVASAKQSIGAAIRGAGQAAADFIPGVSQDNPVKRYGQEVIEANPTAVNSFADIADKPGTAVAEATGNAASSIGGPLAARALGMGITAAAPLTGPAAPVTAAIGQVIAWLGPPAIAALPSFGSIRDKQMLSDPEMEDSAKAKAIAALGAGTVGLIESKFGPQQWAMAALTREGRAQLAKKFAETGILKGLGYGAAKGAAVEGAEELVQNPIEQAASFQDPTTPQNLKETAFGGAMGAIGGGVLGGGTGVAVNLMPQKTAQDILAAPDIDSAIQTATEVLALPAPGANPGETILATERGTAGTAAQFDMLRRQADVREAGGGMGRNADITDVQAKAPAAPIQNDPAALLDRQNGDPLAPMVEDRRIRTEAQDALAREAEQRKAAEMEAIPELATEQNAVQAALARAGTLEAPTAMELALQRARGASAPAQLTAATAPAIDQQSTVNEPALPRIVERTTEMVAMPQKLAEQRAAASGGEVVRIQNQSGKFAFTVIPKAADVSNAVEAPGAVPSGVDGRGADVGGGEPAGGLGDGGRGAAAEPGRSGAADVAVGRGAGQPAAVEPQATWFGRRGDGYLTEGDAQMAIPSRQRVNPDLRWAVERMPSGKFRLAGYAQEKAPVVAVARRAEPVAAPQSAPESAASGAAGQSLSDAPEKWAAKTAEYAKSIAPSAERVGQVAGYSLLRDTRPDWNQDDDGRILAVDKTGNVVADVFFGRRDDGKLEAAAEVAPAARRQGIASAIYDQIERTRGERLAPAEQQTADARAFWEARRREAGATEKPDTATAAPAAPTERERINTMAQAAKDRKESATTARQARQQAEVEKARGKTREGPASAMAEMVQRRKETQAPDTTRAIGEVVSRYTGKYGKGMGRDAARLEAARLNRKNDGVTYTAEEHNDDALENPYAVVGRRPVQSRGGKPDEARQPSAPEATQEGKDAPQFSLRDQQEDQSLSYEEVEQIVDELTAKWQNRPDIRVLDSMSEAPPQVLKQYLAQRSQGTHSRVHGFHLKGTVYIVADEMTSRENVQEVLFHEALGHYGMRELFGDMLKPMLADVLLGQRAQVKAKAKAYGLDMNKQADRLMAAEEVLAELAQVRPELGVIRRLVAAIRTWLRDNIPSFAKMKMTDDELIRKFIIPARGFVERGQSPRPTFTIMGDEGPETVFSLGDNPSVTDSAAFRKLVGVLASPSAARDMLAQSNKPIVDSLERNAEGISNFLERHSIGAHGAGEVRVPRAVVSHVLKVAEDDQVLGAIVRAIPVDVMDLLARKELSPEALLRDKSVLENVLAVDGSTNVSLAIDKSSALSLLRAVAGKAAEIASLANRALKGSPAGSARQGDSVFRTHARSVTESEAFSKWFGDSKVVDSEGKPLVVYHGTDEDFSEFKPGSDGGIHFGTSEQAAKAVGSDTPSARILPVYLSIKNPLRVEDFGTRDWEWGKAIKRAKAAGHDGLVYANEWEGGGDSYVAFRPNQIKSAIGNNGNFDPEDNRVQFSLAGQTNRQYTAEQKRAMRNVGFDTDEPSLRDRARALWQDAGKKMAQGIVDQFAPVKDMDRDAYALLRLSKGASGAFEAFLRGGKLKLTDGVYDFDQTNPGGVVEKLLIPLQGEHHDFFRWIAANRAERLKTEGREHLFSDQDIRALKTLASGTTSFDYTIQTGPQAGTVTRDRTKVYADSQRLFNEFNKNVLDLAEQSGLIDGASRHLWEHEFYVPFYRVADDSDGGVRGMNIKGGMVRQQAFKQLKGGKEALNADLLDNTLMNWAHLLDAAAKNRAAKATLEAAERMGVAINAPQSTAQQIGAATGNKNGIVWFMDGGQKRFFVVDDPYILEAITALEYAGMRNPVMNAMGAFKHALTVGVTASPYFKIRNLIRDSVQVIATGPISFNPAKNIAQGFALTKQGTDEYFRLLAGGGTIHFGTMLEGSEAKRVQALVESGVDDATILNSDNKVKAFYRQFIEPAITAYNELGNRGEAINRAALYDQLRRQGISHREASLQARDLMDFSMQGSFTTIRFLTQVVPFMNARLQGLYKLGRGAKQDPQRFAVVLGAAALMSLSLWAAYSDDDDWKKREEWDRNNYWWFKFGGVAFRIPKPFEIGAIATVAERGAELFFDKEMTGKRFRQQMMQLLGDNLAMNPVPQLLKPILDVYSNRDSFSGRPIETMGMERLKPEYRFTDRTSMTARALSTGMNAVTGAAGVDSLSPVQIDHMIRGYFGWLGSFAVGSADVIARPATGQSKHPTPDYWKVATGGMLAGTADAPSRYVSQMYEQAKEIEQAYGTWRALQKQGKAAEAKEFFEENKATIVKQGRVADVKRAESQLNERIRIIERSTMEPEVKRERIRKLQQQKDKIARRVN